MKPKGRPDKDGFQRFLYPTPGSYTAIDRVSGKRVAKPSTPVSVTIPLDAGAPSERNRDPRLAVKHLQKFAYKSKEHREHFGMRSLVESANKTLMGKNFEDLANVSKRSGRGSPSTTSPQHSPPSPRTSAKPTTSTSKPPNSTSARSSPANAAAKKPPEHH
ncbi:hypothetical protein [Cryobacterium sp. Y62]|uniref:hypothetical protein n=1 Tax=Cryobacterium sp. Y62 TaxID=2048284 RepID=UPI000CE55CF1|nr:hypothetical protein [Cryobacterium sp. Y62]